MFDSDDIAPRRYAVQDSAELRRILEIPRRVWTQEQAAELARVMTEAFRTRTGTQTLRPVQAIALAEMAQWGGAFLPIRVGGGKTLISLLAPRMFPHVSRPLILLPAALRDKTRRELAEYRKHWILPAFVRIESYETLSRAGAADFLEQYQPDLIVADEGHKLKNPGAAVTKRVARYLRKHRNQCVFVIMSGTITKRSIRDFAHLTSWALPKTNPCPEDFNVLDEWSRALDVNVHPSRRLAPGALNLLRYDPEEDIRRAFRRRLVQSPGVVATQEGPLPIGLRIRSHALALPESLRQAYDRLRTSWTTPDDWPIEDGVALWRHARELATGFYSRWNPRPPDDWRDARRAWAAVCREILSSNRRNLDTELQVRQAVEAGLYPEASEILARWKAIAPTFEVHAEAVWLSDETIDWIADHARRHGPCLIWTDRPAVGNRLADRHGFRFYANLGLDATGRFVERHDPERDGSCVVSINANREGRNLQAWSRNLVVDVPPNGAIWEQMLGRTHRDGQRAEVVSVDVLFGCIEDVEAFWRAVKDSDYAEAMTGQAQKLVHADVEDVEDVETARMRTGPQWQKTI